MTIYDIAKLAGVSKSTVSRVLNGESQVSDEARIKVEEVIRANNYTPNRSAAMTKKKRDVILVLVTRLDSYSETRLVRGMMENAHKNIEFLITETQFSIEKTKQLINSNKNVSGIVIFAISGEDYSFLDKSLMPVVIVGQNIETTKHNVYFNDYQSMFDLVKTSNVKNPLFIGYDIHDKTMTTRYQAAVDAFGKEIDKVDTDVYRAIPDLSEVDLLKYDTFISATDYQALNVYKYLIKVNHKNYQILSAGNNQHINFVIENLKTVNFHYKQAGEYIISHIKEQKPFKYVTDYTNEAK